MRDARDSADELYDVFEFADELYAASDHALTLRYAIEGYLGEVPQERPLPALHRACDDLSSELCGLADKYEKLCAHIRELVIRSAGGRLEAAAAAGMSDAPLTYAVQS